jgi:hypothetical protein
MEAEFKTKLEKFRKFEDENRILQVLVSAADLLLACDFLSVL